MRAIYQTVCLLIIGVHCVCSKEVTNTLEVQNECVGSYNMRDAVSSDTLYNQVYKWSHGHKISHWLYQSTNPSQDMLSYFPPNQNLECARIHYTAAFEMPAFFSAFLQTLNIDSTVQIRVRKEVCMHARRVLVELTTVSEHIVGDVQIITRSEIDTAETLKTVSNISIDVPWYATFLHDGIIKSLRDSVSEKIGVVAESLCKPPLPSFALRRVANRALVPRHTRPSQA